MTFIKALDDISVLLISPTIYLSVVLGMLIRCVHEARGSREVIDRKTVCCRLVAFSIANLICQDLHERSFIRDCPGVPRSLLGRIAERLGATGHPS